MVMRRLSILPLYTFYASLSNPQHSAAYEGIIKAAKGSVSEKKLAASFISRFYRNFPTLHDSGMDAMLDLIEDEDAYVSGLCVWWITSCVIEDEDE